RKRLAAGKLTVVDATNVQPEARKPLIQLAREHHCLPVAIVMNLLERECQQGNAVRSDRDFGSHVIRQQAQQLRRSLRGLEREGFRYAFVHSPAIYFSFWAQGKNLSLSTWNSRITPFFQAVA